MKKKLNRKKVTLLIVLLILLIVALIILMKFLHSKDDVTLSENMLAYINSEEWKNETYPTGMPAFVRSYKGKQTAQNIGKSIYYVATEFIPKYNKELKGADKDEIKEYFKENEEMIRLNFGLSYQGEFTNLMNEILKLNTDNLELEEFSIDVNTIRVLEESTRATLHIKYKNCEEIEVGIRVLNTVESASSSVQYY